MTLVEESIRAIESASTKMELNNAFQRTIENYGFSSFGFIDASHAWKSDPLLVTTHSQTWIDTYRRENFLEFDPCLQIARRRNVPFSWGSVPLPPIRGKRKLGAVRTMEAARDFGINEGLTIPFHYNDALGRGCSSVCALFWKDSADSFASVFRERVVELHLVLIYFAQRVVDLREIETSGSTRTEKYLQKIEERQLTDRELEVLKWAGSGKTVDETSMILNLSGKTVEFHMRNAIKKLECFNKTHAVSKALQLGFITIS